MQMKFSWVKTWSRCKCQMRLSTVKYCVIEWHSTKDTDWKKENIKHHDELTARNSISKIIPIHKQCEKTYNRAQQQQTALFYPMSVGSRKPNICDENKMWCLWWFGIKEYGKWSLVKYTGHSFRCWWHQSEIHLTVQHICMQELNEIELWMT